MMVIIKILCNEIAVNLYGWQQFLVYKGNDFDFSSQLKGIAAQDRNFQS